MPEYLAVQNVVAHNLVKDFRKARKKPPESLVEEARVRGRESRRMIGSITDVIRSLPKGIRDKATFILRGSIARMEYSNKSALPHDIDLLIISERKLGDRENSAITNAFQRALPGIKMEPFSFYGGEHPPYHEGAGQGRDAAKKPARRELDWKGHAYDVLAGPTMSGTLVSFLPYKVLHDPKGRAGKYAEIVRKAREDNVLTLLSIFGKGDQERLADGVANHLLVWGAYNNALAGHFTRTRPPIEVGIRKLKEMFGTEEGEVKEGVHKFYIRRQLEPVVERLIRKGKVIRRSDGSIRLAEGAQTPAYKELREKYNDAHNPPNE